MFKIGIKLGSLNKILKDLGRVLCSASFDNININININIMVVSI